MCALDGLTGLISNVDLKPHLFEQLLEFLYLDQVEVNEENAVALLEISCFYQVHRLIAIVETFLRVCSKTYTLSLSLSLSLSIYIYIYI